MSANVVFTLGQFPTGYCWPGPSQYAIDLVNLLTGTVATAGKIIIGPNAPAPSDRDGAWYRLVGGYLEGIYLYNGGWFRPHPIAPASAFRQIWRDTEANLWAADGGDGTNPLVSAPTAVSGSFWQRDLDFGADPGSPGGSVVPSIPVGVGTNPTTYDGNPSSVVALNARTTSGGASGEERHTQVINELVPHQTYAHVLRVQHGSVDTNVFTPLTGDSSQQADSLTQYGGGPNPANTPLPTPNVSTNNMPPFLGVFFIKRTIRTYIQAM